ncbi:MAG: autotransporter domain-containing protein [Verrucomicrobiota bacterium]
MKLKNTNKLALRALAITVTLAAAHAAVITVPPNYTTAVGTFADTIQANTGGSLVTVVAGSTLTGNAAATPALSINAAGYVVNNSGTLTGNTTGAAVAVAGTTTTVTINNLALGRMNSLAAQGISITVGTGSTINNSGIIEGGDDGIRTTTNGLIIANAATGQIRGITGAGSDGIQALDSLTLTNSGTVLGNAIGINAGATVNVNNATGASITGSTRGVSGTTGLIVINNGTITASAAAGLGVTATTGASITNSIGALIVGGADAVQVTTGGSITNGGTIRSSAAVGTVGSDGVQLTDGAVINTGTITGADRGIRYAGVGTVTNSGAISGVVGIDFAGLTAADTLTMTGGTIGVIGTGTSAVLFGAGNDVLNLSGGTITGIVDGGTGSDTLNFNGAAATITGNVTGFETIVRNGTGVATITGATTADAITVTAGGLFLNGNVTPATVGNAAVTLNGGVLGGTGIWNVLVNQTGGSISPGTAPLTIGNLTIGSDAVGTKLSITGGNLLFNMNASTQTSDLLTVSNNLSITPGVASILVSPTTLDAPLQSVSTRAVDVVGARSGQYAAATLYFGAGRTDAGPLTANTADGAFTSSTVSLSVAGGSAALLQDVNDIYVTLVHNYANPALALTSFGQQFGTALNGQVAASLTNPILADFMGYLDYSDATTVAGVLNAYEPTDFQASLAYSVVSAREIHRIVEQQNMGDRMFPGNAHVWGNYNYNDYSNAGSSNRYTIGVGTAIDTFHFGALVSYAESDITDNSKVESLAYGAYLGMGSTTGWQVNGYIGGAHNKTTTSRAVTAFANSPLFSVINFNPDGDTFQALLSGAYMMEAGACTWGPTLGLEYANANLSGSTYPGSALAGMSYSSDTLESLRSLLGLRAEFNFGSKIRPYVSAEWAHEFDGQSNGYTATFQGASFNVNSPINLANDSIIVRAGLVVGFSEGCFGDIGYLGEYSTSGDSADYNGLNVGLRASF